MNEKIFLEKCELLMYEYIDPFEVPGALEAVKDALSSVEPQIVRCKDCANCSSFDDQTIDPLCSIWGRFTTDDSFCSYGERRADET